MGTEIKENLLNYQIFCYDHTPSKIKRSIENKFNIIHNDIKKFTNNFVK